LNAKVGLLLSNACHPAVFIDTEEENVAFSYVKSEEQNSNVKSEEQNSKVKRSSKRHIYSARPPMPPASVSKFSDSSTSSIHERSNINVSPIVSRDDTVTSFEAFSISSLQKNAYVSSLVEENKLLKANASKINDTSTAKKQISELKQSIKDLKDENKKFGGELKKLQSISTKEMTAHGQTKKVLEETKCQLSSMKEDIQEVERLKKLEIKKFQAELKQLSSQVEKKDKDLKLSQTRFDRANENIERLQKVIFIFLFSIFAFASLFYFCRKSRVQLHLSCTLLRQQLLINQQMVQ
jgi:DNA repair exonuclease SbcCD ATPase subunit